MRSVLEAPAPIERTAPSKAPAGRPAFLAFVADAETDKLLHECVTQLALGQITIMRGGIAKAIEHLGQHRSPNILIVDINGVDLPVSKINELADVCEPGVAVIAIGSRNEIGLYRDLLNAGVTEYVVKPVNQQLLAKALTSGRAHTGESSPIQRKLGTLVTFVGARGGVGTTTLSPIGRAAGSPWSTSICRTAIVRWRSTSSRIRGCARRSPIRCASTIPCSSA
jgi:pilus assembly protein CpaE